MQLRISMEKFSDEIAIAFYNNFGLEDKVSAKHEKFLYKMSS